MFKDWIFVLVIYFVFVEWEIFKSIFVMLCEGDVLVYYLYDLFFISV